MKALTEALSQFFRKNDVPVFGISKSDFLENEPAGHRPSDALASAKSLVGFGMPIPRGLFQDKKRLNTNYWRIASIYYQQLDMIASQAAVLVESYGERAVPVFS